MAKKWIYVGVAAATLLILGCTDSRTIDTSGGAAREVYMLPELIAAARPQVRDLPVPLDFKQIEKQSIDFGAASARYVHHVYKGRADKWEVRRFYEKQMTMASNGWLLTTYMNADGNVSLSYEKRNERCRVTISDGDWFYPVRIILQLWTSGPIVVKGTKKTW